MYYAMINNSGFLPDSEPLEFTNEHECIESLLDSLRAECDYMAENNPDIDIDFLLKKYHESRKELDENKACQFFGKYFGVEYYPSLYETTMQGESSYRNALAKMYRDYLNDFLTVSRFAEYYGVSETKANRIIEVGRKCHNFKLSIVNH